MPHPRVVITTPSQLVEVVNQFGASQMDRPAGYALHFDADRVNHKPITWRQNWHRNPLPAQAREPDTQQLLNLGFPRVIFLLVFAREYSQHLRSALIGTVCPLLGQTPCT